MRNSDRNYFGMLLLAHPSKSHLHSLAMAGEQKLKCFHRINRRRIQEPLDHFAFEMLEFVNLVLSFSSFSDHLESQAVGQHNNQPHDFVIVMVGGHLRDEHAVDLQRVDGKAGQPAE